MNEFKIIFFDTETNGLTLNQSVLSISAIKAIAKITDKNLVIEKENTYERFYHLKPGERTNPAALAAHKLTEDIIKIKRRDTGYPLYFPEDINSFKLFCDGAEHFVGHNIIFDKKYISFHLAKCFCTMKANTYVVGLRSNNGRVKFPSLKETATYYNIPIKENDLHGSTYDTMLTYEIFKKMADFPKTKEQILSFLYN